MAEKEALEYLERELAEQITGFDSSRIFYRNQLFRFTMATAFLSAATTVLIAVEKIIGFKELSIITLICSASIAVIAAWDQFLRSRELWIQKTDTWMQLQNLEANVKYEKAKSGQLAQAQIDTFYDRFDKILMGEHEAWKKVRIEQPPRSQTPESGNQLG